MENVHAEEDAVEAESATDEAFQGLGRKVKTQLQASASPTKGKLHRKRKKSKEDTSGRAVIYVGHIPFGFFEEQMKQFFSQFGNVTRLRLARNPKVCLNSMSL